MQILEGIFLLCFCVWSTQGTPVGTSIGSTSGMARVISLDVKCGRSGMNVQVVFDNPFHGVIYSKGYYYDSQCQYVTENNSGGDSFTFMISSDNSCGTSGQLDDATPGKDMFYENTIIIQNDPLIQEVWDQARNLRCTWKHTMSKKMKSKSFKIQEPQKTTIDFDARAVNTLMQIQRGNSPFSEPATGYIYAGEESSIVIYLQDSNDKLDANPISCYATSSKYGIRQLVDRNGCVLEPNMITPFTKIRNPEGVKATMMMFANFKSFEVDDEFKMTCQLEICENQCLEACALGPYQSRRKRQAYNRINTEVIEVEGGAIVIAKEVEEEPECYLSELVASTVVTLVFVCSLLCFISCYLAYKLHLLKSQLSLYVKQ